MYLKLTPSSTPIFLSSCRMARGHEEVSTSQAGRRRGTPWEMPIANSLVVAMSAEELRLYNQFPAKIILETSDDAATSTFGEVDNVVYFTREQFVVGLRLPIPLLVKQFCTLPERLLHSYIRTLFGF